MNLWAQNCGLRSLGGSLGNDLAAVAASAAIELDNLLLGRNPSLTAVAALADRLRCSRASGANLSTRESLFDPATVVVVGQTLAAFEWAPPASTVEQLLTEADRIAARLQDPTLGAETEALEHMRSFCLELSRRAAAYLELVEAAGERHPFQL
jgi:hypothetical protein